MSDNQAVVMNQPQGMPVAAGLRPLLLLLGLAAAVAAGVGLAPWAKEPNHRLLFGDVSDADRAQLTQSLDQAGIHYKLQGGDVLVPSEHADQARMAMAAKGLPANSGFSIMEKDPGFGVS